MSNSSQSRRSFLGVLSGLAASSIVPRTAAPLATQLAALAALACQSSHAADVSGYKALVCLYMHGGSDSHNWVVPVDTTSYAEYASARAELAWPLERLQTIAGTGQEAGRSFAMPVELAALRQWYEKGQAAVVANVGPLMRPITKADYLAGNGLPSKLFSHNDQASTWQSLSPEGAPSGWGGRMGDILMSANAHPVFTAVSTTGNAVFLSGSSLNQFQVGAEGPASVKALATGSAFGSSTATAALRRAYATTGADRLQAEYSRVMQRSLSANATLQTALTATAVAGPPATPVAQVAGGSTTLGQLSLTRQLHTVLKMIAANQALGMKRQIFMVSMSGFDTHANQMRDQPAQMAQVALAIDYFMSSLNYLGLQNNVTLFTASDFGRALLSNGAGSDHGWGSHHFVTGGAVRGRSIQGKFPTVALGTNTDIGSGRLLPSTSVSELAANLGGWMGLTPDEQVQVLPNLSNFSRTLTLF